jgi:hypothetical protein
MRDPFVCVTKRNLRNITNSATHNLSENTALCNAIRAYICPGAYQDDTQGVEVQLHLFLASAIDTVIFHFRPLAVFTISETDAGSQRV